VKIMELIAKEARGNYVTRPSSAGERYWNT